MKSISSVFFCYVLTISAIMLCAHYLPADTSAEADRSAKVLDVVENLKDCPCWFGRGVDSELRADITRKYMKMAQNETGILREAVIRALSYGTADNSDPYNMEPKIFAFLRIVFNVPQGYIEQIIKSDNSKYVDPTTTFGCFGSPCENGKVDLLWPYTYNKNGQFELVGEAAHIMGIGYDPLKDFDALNARFGRRFLFAEIPQVPPMPR